MVDRKWPQSAQPRPCRVAGVVPSSWTGSTLSAEPTADDFALEEGDELAAVSRELLRILFERSKMRLKDAVVNDADGNLYY
jgi:hypothetical protein